MSVLTRFGQRRATRYGALAKAIVVGTMATIAACSQADSPAGPQLTKEPSNAPQLRKAAFIADVNMRTGAIKFTAPSSTQLDGPSLSISGGGDRPDLSILAGDAVTLIATNFRASTVGAFTPGKVRVTFEVSVLNKLQGYALVTPTFPAAPVAGSGAVLFPFEMNVTTTSGGTTVGGDGTEVIIDLPSYGEVAASTDWNGDGTAGSGAPNNFFNDNACAVGDNDCFRWESYGSTIPVPGAPAGTTTKGIPSLATSASRVVGFDVDPTVGQFRARMIVAADLMAATPPVGDLTGTVNSPQRGNLSGVQVSVSGTATPASTNGSGVYSFTGLPIGPKTVSIVAASLPAGCTAPASQNTSIVGSSSVTVNFSVTCTVPSGTVQGTVSSSLGGALANVTATVTPTGLAAQPGVLTNAAGLYVRSGVPVGTGAGSIALSGLPANCTNPGAQPYSGLADGGTVTVNITVSCTAPPQNYQWTYSIVSTSGTQVTVDAQIDMSGFNDPTINGAGPDDIGSATFTINYNSTQLSFVSAAAVPGSGFNVVTANGATAGQIAAVSQPSDGVGRTGIVPLIRIVFNRVGSGPNAVTTTALTDIVDATASHNLVPKIQVTEASIPRP
ncbi:MAG TPA: hypothetical protein VFT29_07420 [Gemmatimonadaceae bacterium]|nr:hypothetical protein [Gemmatimonadaceae bacterium]